ncbi:DUF2637 domain-containing protein [Streptomyces sp. NPDC005562]|uniref:DUF2637 domain-containing protein n=1 Tax=Streptomyces sp. NPDC005562 TaxID=3154890 RepID=UPI0033B0A331
MWNEQNYYHPGFSDEQAPGQSYGHAGPYGDPAGQYSALTDPPVQAWDGQSWDGQAWDPAEELAFLLQESIADQSVQNAAVSEAVLVDDPTVSSPLQALQDITAELPPLRASPQGHRKVRERRRPHLARITSYAIAALVALTASAVSFFSTAVTYDPLRLVAEDHTKSSVTWWPVLIFGPWLVASLAVLRAALHQRRAVHSWCVVITFSLITMLLCVAQAPRDVIDITAAVLPSLASLACFQQLVRQITLTRPPRRPVPRHRLAQANVRVPSSTEETAHDMSADGSVKAEVPRPRAAGLGSHQSRSKPD